MLKMADSSPKEWKTLGEKEKLLVTMFSKDLHCRHVKTRVCLGKG